MKVFFRIEARVRSTQEKAYWNPSLQKDEPGPFDSNECIKQGRDGIKRYSAYSLCNFGAIEVSKRTIYYTFFQKTSVFEFIDYCKSIIPSCEVFLDYRVMRKGKEYFLDSTIETISQELVDSYIWKIKDWLAQNAHGVTEEPFEMPELNHDNMIENATGNKLKLNEEDNIRRFDSFCVLFGFSRNIYWDTGWPEYEGNGLEIFLAVTSIALTLYPTYDTIRNKIVNAKIKSFEKKIRKKYKPLGILNFPNVNSHQTSKKFKCIYTFTEQNSIGSTMAYYRVCVPRSRGRIKIMKIPID